MALMLYPEIGFGIVFGEEIIYCEVIMSERSYKIYFNCRLMASDEPIEELN